MSRNILTYGYDACHRWAVLRLAGFTVQPCESIAQLRDRLIKRTPIDAIIMVEDIVSVPNEAITAARSYFDGPLVLFESRSNARHRGAFDLSIPILTSPSVWLAQLEALMQTPSAPVTEAAPLKSSILL